MLHLRKQLQRLFLGLLFLAHVFTLAQTAPATDRRPFVLVLHSYSPSPWDNNLQAGIDRELLDQARIDLYIDYMDSRKIESAEYFESLRQLLAVKYKQIHFDLVIVCDDNAYQFARQHHGQLWPGAPVVFCGVNEFRAAEFASLTNTTGISENNELGPFVSAFPKLVPGLKSLYIIRDDSPYSQDTLPHLLAALRKILPELQIHFLEKMSAAELAEQLENLSSDSAVFYLSFWKEKNGRFINGNEAQRIISHSQVPVFTTHLGFVGTGALGASYVAPLEHGAAAGKLALRILQGSPVAALPAAIGPPRSIRFDYPSLQKFKIPPEALPAGSEIINEPFSFYREYPGLVWSISLTFTLLSTLVLMLVINVLQRRRAILRLTATETALRESEQKFARAFNDSPVGMAIHGLNDERYIEVNSCALSLLGYTREELVGHSIQELGLLEASDIEENRRLLAEGKGLRDRELIFRSKNGRPLPCSYSTHAVRIGGHECVLSIILDLSQHKRAEAEREALQNQLNQIQKMESVGRLAGGVAHDFNNLLTAVHINATLVREALPPESPLIEGIDEILQCTHRSADLTRQLLAFARKQTIAPKILDLNDTVGGMLKMLQRLIGENIQLSWRPTEQLWPVKIDPSQVDQVLANLCVNARDAIGGVGKITIETSNASFDDAFCSDHAGHLPGDFVMLGVSDNGCGMNKEVLGHLFEPFFTTKEVGRGTGLGLATVYGIVKQNNAFINVYSEPGHGTSFKLYIPRHAQAPAKHVATETDSLPDRGHETILLVEDELMILRITQRTLLKLGYTVLTASSPSEAIQVADTYDKNIQLLITDVVMPEMNGLELSRRILEKHPGIKRLFMSGYTADVIAHQGVLADGVHFISKPFSIHQLSNKVRAVLDVEADHSSPV